jgi:hypothetical protein
VGLIIGSDFSDRQKKALAIGVGDFPGETVINPMLWKISGRSRSFLGVIKRDDKHLWLATVNFCSKVSTRGSRTDLLKPMKRWSKAERQEAKARLKLLLAGVGEGDVEFVKEELGFHAKVSLSDAEFDFMKACDEVYADTVRANSKSAESS